MSPADDHSDPPNRGVPRPRDWMDAYIHFRLAALDPDLEEVGDPEEAPEADGGPQSRDQTPPVPEVTAEELAAHLAHLAERYRRRPQR
ncbi:hypothetical protein LP52_07295 [Streptomonospora alba]|uniref:Uncharacterized protein n=1 Tax=Streptomonospora alba TaxID=183763 RepID=A0A0C2FJC5_9ACTN|nr:hypothetical protein [Streptomonospora alba]KIH99444.1 hypothetical protein LP52_07295 [Streptomonospora alba]